MKLKKGWNQIEAKLSSNFSDVSDGKIPGAGPLSVWVSGGITTDGLSNIRPSPLAGETSLNIPFKDIPWVIRDADTYTQMVSPTEAPTVTSPYWK
jgi:hypothetical protein